MQLPQAPAAPLCGVTERTYTTMLPAQNPNENDAEPTADELDAIEAEWPVIAAELDLLDAQITAVTAGRSASLLDWRRVRRAEHRVMAVSRELAGKTSTTPAHTTAVAS